VARQQAAPDADGLTQSPHVSFSERAPAHAMAQRVPGNKSAGANPEKKQTARSWSGVQHPCALIFGIFPPPSRNIFPSLFLSPFRLTRDAQNARTSEREREKRNKEIRSGISKKIKKRRRRIP
jgi:hypothetical protein